MKTLLSLFLFYLPILSFSQSDTLQLSNVEINQKIDRIIQAVKKQITQCESLKGNWVFEFRSVTYRKNHAVSSSFEILISKYQKRLSVSNELIKNL